MNAETEMQHGDGLGAGPDPLDELRADCGYDPRDFEGRGDALVDYKDALEGRGRDDMRDAAQIRLDVGATSQEIAEHETKGTELRKRLGLALAEARDHPELTLEEARKIPEKEIPRQTANRLIKKAT